MTTEIGNLAVRVNPRNPDHHLFNNHGTWWCHYTIHLPDYTKRRIRVSLGTRDVAVAQNRRDGILGIGPSAFIGRDR